MPVSENAIDFSEVLPAEEYFHVSRNLFKDETYLLDFLGHI